MGASDHQCGSPGSFVRSAEFGGQSTETSASGAYNFEQLIRNDGHQFRRDCPVRKPHKRVKILKKMDTTNIRQIILNIIADIMPDAHADSSTQSLEQLKDDVPLREQLDLDSMDFLDIVLELRKKFHLDIPEADYPKLETLQSCIEYLRPKLEASR
jgi:acyl carrier protein